MEGSIIFFGAVLPCLIGGALGYAIGYRRFDTAGMVLHVVLGILTVFLLLLLSGASGWDGIVYLIFLIPVAIGWITLCIGHLIGYLVSR